MLSRFVVSQVKHNSYFLVGLGIGLWLALAVVPLGEDGDECVSAVMTEVADDEFAPVREERPLGGGGAARAIQRPRYYTTELGMRAPLLAAVLSSEAALGQDGRAAALNTTASHLQPALRFFIAASAPATPGLPNVVGFTDTREMLKPFHALKYLADNYLDEYDFFFLVSDSSFVNARRLNELVSKLSVSQDVYMGMVAEDDSHYCTLESGILLSNSVLRSVHNELDWCVRNSYSAHHHENIGRCVLHAAHQACTPELQSQKYLSVRDDGAAPPVSLPDAVTAFPVGEPKRFHELHAYVSRVYLERDAASIGVLSGALARTARRHPPGYRNASWPRGLRNDAGLAPHKPDNRWDHLRWTAFNASHAFMPDDHRTVGPLTGATAKAVQLVVDTAKAWALRRWSADDVTLIEGAWRWEPPTALRYYLLLNVQGPGGNIVRRVEAARTLGAARLVPLPYVTESSRVWLVLPARSPALGFLRRYRPRHNTALVAVIIHPNPESEAVKAEMRTLAAKYPAYLFHTVETTMPQGYNRTSSPAVGAASRAALEAAGRVVPKDGLVLLVAPNADFNDDFLNRVRMNTMLGEQWYLPVGFARYAQYSHPRFVDERGNKPQTDTGRFPPAPRAAALAAYRADVDAVLSNAPQGLSVAELLAKSKLRCIRAPEPGLIFLPPGPTCGVGLSNAGQRTPEEVAQCLKEERDAGFQNLDLGARHTLAKLILEVQSERA